MLQEEWKDQDVGSCEQWLNIKNNWDYSHSIEKKPRLFVRCTGCCIYEYLSNVGDRPNWFGIDRLRTCVHVDIDSWSSLKHSDHAHWFGID